ncbi:TAXI family TRAP transporter solute-binding subunit [Planktomarina temperata]|uniref:TAXI family TRAP transporter solute-binding subunit n=1 Tax=Planktomarina temperata TaxID=1284658 RepID=UPI002303BD7B|nr:TAXI family TRAP transporter solute-binding subunit [Planktomarina temperata]MDA7455518.1 TAXI family TRAP transporter solute-binding subunit [Planktomarina temperata]MDA7474917.1 TAXI family TRAP transporter solute-binding subunit [Planktomarina temperata]MDA8684670.1 TAXI family TRAP transporter solute-binding subunit [Planktomarina temperata]MDA8767803.1 TAXI family TRAP transporter solute-binding subunit [Planktomarina temperata]
MKFLFTAAAFSVAALVGGTASAQNVGIATSNPGSLFHNIGTAVANAANANGLNTTIQPATSPNQFIPFVNDGGIEFGVANLQEVNYSITGEAWWNGKKNENIRVVGHLQPLVEAIFVRKDSDIMKVGDLRGKAMTDGYTAQNTILPQLSAFYATAGMTRDDVEQVSVASVVAGANAFMAGDTVGFIFAHGAGKVREADAAVGGLRALGVDDSSDAALAAARGHWPTAFFKKLKAGAMPGVLEDDTYIAFPQVVFTHAGASDEAVYQMAKAMYEQGKVMGETFPPMRAFKPADMRGDIGISEFHPGAIRFYEEVGLK